MNIFQIKQIKSGAVLWTGSADDEAKRPRRHGA